MHLAILDAGRPVAPAPLADALEVCGASLRPLTPSLDDTLLPRDVSIVDDPHAPVVRLDLPPPRASVDVDVLAHTFSLSSWSCSPYGRTSCSSASSGIRTAPRVPMRTAGSSPEAMRRRTVTAETASASAASLTLRRLLPPGVDCCAGAIKLERRLSIATARAGARLCNTRRREGAPPGALRRRRSVRRMRGQLRAQSSKCSPASSARRARPLPYVPPA